MWSEVQGNCHESAWTFNSSVLIVKNEERKAQYFRKKIPNKIEVPTFGALVGSLCVSCQPCWAKHSIIPKNIPIIQRRESVSSNSSIKFPNSPPPTLHDPAKYSTWKTEAINPQKDQLNRRILQLYPSFCCYFAKQ